MNVSIVLLNWNAADDTIACLQPVLSWQQVRPLLIVVDNASAPADVARLRAALATAHLIENSQNEGFSGGTNRGMAYALAQGDDPILLLNNDATIGETALGSHLEAARAGGHELPLVAVATDDPRED